MRTIAWTIVGHLLVASGLILIGFAAAHAIEARADPPPLLVQADYPVCVTARPAPLLPPPPSKYEYRLDLSRKDGGDA